MKVKKLALLGLLPITLVVICCLTCSSMIVGDAVNLRLRRQAAERVYERELGISNRDDEIEMFMTEELKGLTHQEAMEKLSQWGDVEVKDCSTDGTTSGRCVVHVSNFLGTEFGHEFTVFYEDSKVRSVRIYYS